MVDAGDVAAAAAALQRDSGAGGVGAGRVFTLTGPQSFAGAELVDTIAVGTGQRLIHRDLTPPALAQLLSSAGAPPVMTQHLTELFGYFRTGALDLTTDDITHLTGRAPTSLAEFLATPGGGAVSAPARL